jgi:nicotinamidase-related amidase
MLRSESRFRSLFPMIVSKRRFCRPTPTWRSRRPRQEMNPPQSLRSPDLLSAPQSLLLVVDVQERLMPHITDGPTVAANCARLIQAARLFDVPVVVSEQYPQGLGHTIAEVAEAFSARTDFPVTKIEKLRFSAAVATGWPAAGDRADSRHQVVLSGVETHICVLQTAFDLLSQGYRVYVVADATSSRRALDRDLALNRLRDGGAVLITTESLLFEWCEEAGTETFRAMRTLVTSR